MQPFGGSCRIDTLQASPQTRASLDGTRRVIVLAFSPFGDNGLHGDLDAEQRRPMRPRASSMASVACWPEGRGKELGIRLVIRHDPAPFVRSMRSLHREGIHAVISRNGVQPSSNLYCPPYESRFWRAFRNSYWPRSEAESTSRVTRLHNAATAYNDVRRVG